MLKTGSLTAFSFANYVNLIALKTKAFKNTALQTTIWTILIFIVLTLLTMKNEASSDGLNTYGFPFTFYDHFTGKCDDCYGKFGFKKLNFILDVLIITATIFTVITLKSKTFFKR